MSASSASAQDEDYTKMFAAALAARANSYSPISGFKVGAAILTETGNIYAGTNVEDAGFNSTIHAEAGAIAQMIVKEGHTAIRKVVVVGGQPGDGTVCSPCGHCRQLLGEFNRGGMEIAAAGPEGDIRLKTTLAELLPHSFSMANFR